MQGSEISALSEKTSSVPMIRTAYAPEVATIAVTDTHTIMVDEVYHCRKSAVREICTKHLSKLAPRSELLAAKFAALAALVPAVSLSKTTLKSLKTSRRSRARSLV